MTDSLPPNITTSLDSNVAFYHDLKEIQFLLQETNKKIDCDVGLPFNTNILKIALNLKETKLASILAYKYKVLIYEEMIIRAVKTDQFEFMF